MTDAPNASPPPSCPAGPAQARPQPVGYPVTLHHANTHLTGELAFPVGTDPWAIALIVQPTSLGDPGPYAIAQELLAAGLAVLRADLLTPGDIRHPDALRDVPLLESRLASCLFYLQGNDPRILGLPAGLPLGIVASHGAAPAALRLTASRQGPCRVLATRRGFIDQAGRHALGGLDLPLLYVAEPLAADQPPEEAGEVPAAQHALTLVTAPHDMVRAPHCHAAAMAISTWLQRWLPR